jgi:hypothetical protein
MELIDLSSLEIFTWANFPTLAFAQHVMTRSDARAGFALHLLTSSNQPYVKLHYNKGSKLTKDKPVVICGKIYRHYWRFTRARSSRWFGGVSSELAFV